MVSGSFPARTNERRRHPRFSVEDCEITLTRSGLMNTIGIRKENLARNLLDLSEGGLRVRTTEKLDKGARVRVRVVMKRFSDEIEALGEVRWSGTHPIRPTEHLAGIMFTKIDPQHARRIVNMRNWFTSPQYRQKRDHREKESPKSPLDLIE